MKTAKLFTVVFIATALTGCNSPKGQSEPGDIRGETGMQQVGMAAEERGAKIDSLIGEALPENWKTARPARVLGTDFDLVDGELLLIKGEVTDVCQKKGCWMKLDQGNDQKLRVTFKDYALFMPKDLAGRSVVIRGRANRDTIPVEDLRHYAEDEGKSAEEIARITQPEIKITFEADGVAILKPAP